MEATTCAAAWPAWALDEASVCRASSLTRVFVSWSVCCSHFCCSRAWCAYSRAVNAFFNAIPAAARMWPCAFSFASSWTRVARYKDYSGLLSAYAAAKDKQPKIGGGVTHKVVLGSLRELLLGGISQVRVCESRQVSTGPGDGIDARGGCYAPGDSELVRTELISGADAPSMMAVCGSGATREMKDQEMARVRRRRKDFCLELGRSVVGCTWKKTRVRKFCLTFLLGSRYLLELSGEGRAVN